MSSLPTTTLLCAFSALLGPLTPATGDDWPQWQGPHRTGHSTEANLQSSWPQGGPRRLWLYENCGTGYSSPAIVENRLYIMGSRSGTTHLLAIDTHHGNQVWATPISPEFDENQGNGPRGTPSVAGNHVYGLSCTGILICANVRNGQEVWRRTMQDFGGSMPGYGFSESVLIEGDLVICTPGGQRGSVVALERNTGKLRWQSRALTDGAHYTSMLLVNHLGHPQLIQLLPSQVVGLSPDNGRVLWQIARDGPIAVATTPIYHNGNVYVSSAYGAGCLMFHVDADNHVQEIYRNKILNNHHGGVMLVGNVLVGSDGNNSDRGFVCQNFLEGNRVWHERTGLGGGAVIYADDRLYTLSEKDATVRLAEVSEKGWTVHGQFQLEPQSKNRKSGRVWTHPALANGKLYLRDQEYIFCYDVRKP